MVGTKMPAMRSANFCTGGLAALCVLHGTDDVGQQRVVPHLLGAENETALLVDGTRQYTVARTLAHGQRFAAQHAFVHVRLSVHDRAVHGHALAGLHQKQIADGDLFQWERFF